LNKIGSNDPKIKLNKVTREDITRQI
jgi:hypothetical protein